MRGVTGHEGEGREAVLVCHDALLLIVQQRHGVPAPPGALRGVAAPVSSVDEVRA